MKSVLLTVEYFGPVSSYQLINNSDTAYIEHHETYQKKSYRNRCIIATPNGQSLLSVPLKRGKSNNCPIQEVEISYEFDWISEHSQALLAAYGSSPFYEFYIEDIKEIWAKKPDLLVDLNVDILAFICKSLDIETPVSPTDAYEKLTPPQTIDLRKYHYSNRAQLNIPLNPYWQVWSDRHPFQADMSILDLLFCKGPEGILYF